MDPELLSLLRCPRTGQALRPVGADGASAPGPDDAVRWLVTEDGSLRYPVADGVPSLIDAMAEPADGPAPSPGRSRGS